MLGSGRVGLRVVVHTKYTFEFDGTIRFIRTLADELSYKIVNSTTVGRYYRTEVGVLMMSDGRDDC